MNNIQLIAAVAVTTGKSEVDVAKVLAGFWDVVGRALRAGDAVTMSSLGKFYVQRRVARNGKNPKTGATLLIQAKNKVAFSSSPNFDGVVN